MPLLLLHTDLLGQKKMKWLDGPESGEVRYSVVFMQPVSAKLRKELEESIARGLARRSPGGFVWLQDEERPDISFEFGSIQLPSSRTKTMVNLYNFMLLGGHVVMLSQVGWTIAIIPFITYTADVELTILSQHDWFESNQYRREVDANLFFHHPKQYDKRISKATQRKIPRQFRKKS